MRYIIVEYSNGYAGCDYQEYLCFPENTTEQEINKHCLTILTDYSKFYECVLKDREVINNIKDYYDNCNFNWKEIDPKEDPSFCKEDWFKIN